MRPDDIFEALSDIDEDLIAGAKHIEGGDSQVIVIKRAPLWKTIAGWGAAAACLVVLVVGGVFGIKYFSGRNAALDSDTSGASDTSVWKSDCHAYNPPEYPKEAKYVYTGDYSELAVNKSAEVDRIIYTDFAALKEESELIVVGEFTDDPRQCFDPAGKEVTQVLDRFDQQNSFNRFRADRVIKGDLPEGEEIIIAQNGYVYDGRFEHYSNLTPMLKGDKWVYFLTRYGNENFYSPLGLSDGRYPVPGTEHEFVLCDNVYGVFDMSEFRSEVYDEVKRIMSYPNEKVVKDFDGVVLTVMTNGKSFAPDDEIYVRATVRNNTDKPIGLWMPVQGENTHTEIDTRITRGLYSLTDVSATGVANCALDSHIIEPGGEYVQNMTFKANFKGEVGETGEYKGRAAIFLLDDPNDVGSKVTVRLVEFSLTIGGEETADRSVEKVYDTYADSDTVRWTMDEFPGVIFNCDGDSVTALTEGVKDADGNEVYASQTLYSGMPVCDVYLADLNYDGKREIISTVCMGSGIVDVHVEAYDFAGNVHYTLENRMYCDYALKEDGGRLIVQTSRYMENEVMTEETLSLDMMYGHPIERPVAVISRSSDVSWVMEEFPGVTFRADFLGISADNGIQTPIYKDVIVYDVMLCDINNDGKREIITQIKKSTDGHDAVRAYDYANGVCYEYSSDEMNNMLRYYNGELSVCVYTDGTLFTEFELTKPLEEEIVIPADKPEGLILPIRSFTGYSDLNEKTGTDFPSFYQIGTTNDEPVYAVASGKVIDASGVKIEGFDDVPHDYTAILGDDGKYYYYGSLGDMRVKVGDKVTAGQRIGTVGAYEMQYGKYAFGITFVCADEPIN